MLHLVKLASERLANVFMFGELNRLNQELDRRVKDRTEELTLTNKNLNREISERKIVEKALRANEGKLRSVYNAAIDVSFITFDLSDKYLVRSYSPGAEKMFGYTPQEVIGKPLQKFQLLRHTDFFENLKKEFEEVGWSRQEEVKLRRKSGNSFIAMLTLYPLFNEDLKLMDALAVCIDITELKRTQNQLIKARKKAEESEFKFRSLFEQASDGIYITDKKGNFIELNESGSEMLGYSKDEILYLNIKDVVQKDIRNTNQSKNEQLDAGKVIISQLNLIKKNGTNFPVEISEKMISDGRIQGMVRDITDRIKFEKELIEAKERAEENDRLKTSFLQNMSHEIRTPLNAILGFADLLPQYFGDEDLLVNFAGIIKQRGNDLLAIINDILDIARIESGLISNRPVVCKLDRLLNELDQLFRDLHRRLSTDSVVLDFLVPDYFKDTEIVVDQVKIKQILTNLVGNAFKFTSSGKVVVGCSILEKGVITFYVSDTGIGISEEKHNEIFQRFIQATSETSQLYGGTGLGLSIVKGLLDVMGGTINLKSIIGKGSTFDVSIPVSFVNQACAATIPVESNMTSEGSIILIVEDDEYNTEYLKEILQDSGSSFIHCMYGKQAIELCNSQQIQIILMDIRLLDMDGYEMIRILKKNYPEVKIIVQTAYATHDDKQKALEAGCDDYLSKPIKSDLLLSRISFYQQSFKHS
jgi:PAS domain S-box-containing protein